MTDIDERLVRFAGKVCISTDTEVEAAAIIKDLRAENDKLFAKCVDYRRRLSSFIFDYRNLEGECDALRAENARLLAFVQRLASMPSTDEDMLHTFSPPDWDDLCDWWREYVAEARKLTGLTYKVTP